MPSLTDWIFALPEQDPHTAILLTAIVVALLLVAAGTRRRQRSTDRNYGGSQVQALIEAGRYEDAGDLRREEGEFEKALALYLNGGNTARAAECYLSLNQAEKAARLYREMGRLAEAAHHYQSAGAWADAATCLQNLGNHREAAELYERAGDFAKAAHLLRGLGDAESAARLFERGGLAREAAAALLDARRNDPRTLKKAGELFERAGERRRAAESFAAAADWERAAGLFEEIGENALAAQAYERAEDWTHAGEAYERGGALPEARANFEKAADRVRAAEISLRLGQWLDAGRAFYELGAYERAIECLQSILNDSPQFRMASLYLGRIFLEKGLLDRAQAKLEQIEPKSLESKDDLEILTLLADIYERREDYLAAMRTLERVHQFDAGHDGIAERLERLQERAWSGTLRHTIDQTGRYELLDEIGRGGMGVVHLAQDRELERPVALKFLPPDLAKHQGALKLFRKEARAAAAMNHPNIVQIYDVASIDNRPCIVMEFVQGRTVRQLMRIPNSKNRRPLPPVRIYEIAREVCNALAYAHHQQVIHRDVKPANILISDRGQTKLMDFGISKMIETEGDDATQAKGTPQYMAPEQILGREIDGRADLYALGIAMFEMATGIRPFRGEDVVDQHLHREFPCLLESNPDLPESLANITKRACEKDSDDRYDSARTMADAITEALDKLRTEMDSD